MRVLPVEQVVTKEVISPAVGLASLSLRLESDTDPVKYKDQFQSAYEAERLLEAQAILEVAEDDEEVPRFYVCNWRGLLALRAAFVVAAEALFRAALEYARSSNEMAVALVNLAAVQIEREQFNKAEAICRLALSHRPTYEPAWVNLLEAVLRRGDSVKAQEVMREILSTVGAESGAILRWHIEHDGHLEAVQTLPKWLELKRRLGLGDRALAT